jgi:hypothetical protein
LRDYKVKIMLENTNSEKTYYTDENGNLELKFDEIIPESTEVDSTFSLIIEYGDLIDTVKVKRL